jgi:hypothetical protein
MRIIKDYDTETLNEYLIKLSCVQYRLLSDELPNDIRYLLYAEKYRIKAIIDRLKSTMQLSAQAGTIHLDD